MLQEIRYVTVVGQCVDADELLDRVAADPPDLVITELLLGGSSGLDALSRIREHWPAVRVLILSKHDDAGFVQQALARGASGYLLKDMCPNELRLAIDSVTDDHLYLCPRVSRHLADRLRIPPVGRMMSNPRHPLTERQHEVLTQIARGRATKEIAHSLGLSSKTIETHRSMLMDRLGIREVAGLVRYAVRHGLVAADES